MATVTTENIGLLHEKLTVNLEKTDYLPAFEKALKEYSKKANIPGFRKGMVPSGVIKKMYGPSVFTDEVLRSVDRELIKYLETSHLDIFAQPLPLETDIRQMDMNNPAEYSFHFEVGKKPEFNLSEIGKAKIIRYKVSITGEMIDSEVTRLQNRYGNMLDKENVDSEENVLNVIFTPSDEAGNKAEVDAESQTGKKDNSLLVKYFTEDYRKNLIGKKAGESFVIQLKTAFDEKEREWVISDLGLNKEDPTVAENYYSILITKIGLLEKRELNEEFFKQLYPGIENMTEETFRNKIKDEIHAYWDNQARNQIHDQLFHELVDHTEIKFPEDFLKKWIKTQNSSSEKKEEKTDEQVEKEFPKFLDQLKWTLISDKIVSKNDIKVLPEEIKDFVKQQLLGYMGMSALDDQQTWVKDYIEKMMKDRKYVEDAHIRIQTQKMFSWAETQINATDKEISAEDFATIVQEHQHHHH